MISNSEFLVLLNQAASDRTKLAELLHISDTQLSYVTDSEAGRGLLKMGGSLVPVSYTHLSSETAATGKAFLKGYVGVCLEGAVIVLSCLIYSAYMGSGSPAAPSGSAVSMVWTLSLIHI